MLLDEAEAGWRSPSYGRTVSAIAPATVGSATSVAVTTAVPLARPVINPASESTEMGVLEPVRTAEILVLDDLGAEHRGRGESLAATWAEDKLYQIVDQRVVAELPTIFTTNLTRALIAPRLSSRMWNERYALVVAVTGILDSESAVRRSSAQPTSSHT